MDSDLTNKIALLDPRVSELSPNPRFKKRPDPPGSEAKKKRADNDRPLGDGEVNPGRPGGDDIDRYV